MNSRTGMYVGIGISVAIVVVIAVIMLGLNLKGGNPIGEPNKTSNPAMLKKIDLNLDIYSLVTPPPASAEGAEVLYADAVKLAVEYGPLFSEHAKKYPDFMANQEKMRPIVDKIVQAADKGLGDKKLRFEALPPISPLTEWDTRAILYGIQLAVSYDVLRHQNNDMPEAEKAARAMLIYGLRLYNNSEDFMAYRSAGIASTSEALASAKMIWETNSTKGPIIKSLDEKYKPLGLLFYEKQQIILKDPNKINCADLWNIAEHDEDKAWRIEGVMWLGVAKWTSAPPKQRAAIDSYLASKASSSDPVIAKYAAEARKFARTDVAGVGNALPR